MFAVIYAFTVREGKQKEFLEAWKGLTELIYSHEGSLGSRLHQASEYRYIAYARWPEKDSWEKSGSKLPETATPFRTQMRESCETIETLYQLEIVDDLLKEDKDHSL